MDKLQELTQRLYEEGLSKGKAEAEEILAKAKAEAEAIVIQAKEEADAIISAAQKEADAVKTKIEGDVKMAAIQAIQATRSDIENLVVAKAVDAPVSAALSEPGFLKEVIAEVAKRFSAEESQDLALVLPERLQKELEPFLAGELAAIAGKGVEAAFSKKVAGGFRIGPKDGSYFISLTDESFKALIGEYLRPATKKLLFGE
jgi:V/A-type H+-transporting ATPase subunit E